LHGDFSASEIRFAFRRKDDDTIFLFFRSHRALIDAFHTSGIPLPGIR